MEREIDQIPVATIVSEQTYITDKQTNGQKDVIHLYKRSAHVNLLAHNATYCYSMGLLTPTPSTLIRVVTASCYIVNSCDGDFFLSKRNCIHPPSPPTLIRLIVLQMFKYYVCVVEIYVCTKVFNPPSYNYVVE